MGAQALEFLACPLQLAAIPGADGEAGALAGKLLRHGETKPARCAGDQDHAFMEVEGGEQPPRQRPRRDPSANTGRGKSETSNQGDAAAMLVNLASGFVDGARSHIGPPSVGSCCWTLVVRPNGTK